MNYKVNWTTIAYSDFSQIVQYIRETWGKTSAEDFIKQVDSVINILSIYPQLGKIIHQQKQIRALVISKQISLIYRIKSDRIIILNLFDNRQKPDKLKVNESTSKYEA
jgi:plasmid stabilization system protein ParE